MKLTHVVRMIRGERGTKLVLRVQLKDSTETQLYELTREKIELSAQEVKGEIIDAQTRLGRPGKIGVIKLPTFYRDFAGAQGGIEGFKSAAADMIPYLAEFRKQGVEAVIVDLRNNTGGALSEAIEVTGHFIDEGPVVQVRESEVNGAKVLDDEIPGTLWNGPLVLICNRLSASASEIFAGAIKDYHRGIIIGDFTTHGKGTVQNLMEVAPSQMFRLFDSPDRGKLKLTIQQFYRVNGDSTQNYGVRSDIVLPSILDHMDMGESFLDHALPFHKITEARYSVNALVNPETISALQTRSQQRVTAQPDLQKLTKAIARYEERKSRETITLSEESLRKEREIDELTEKELDPEAEEAIDDIRSDEEKPVFKQDAYTDEVLAITLDYVQGAEQPRDGEAVSPSPKSSTRRARRGEGIRLESGRPAPRAGRTERCMRSRRGGFTLIELLVVIAIFAILVALLLPAIQQTREAARQTTCRDHLHNIGIALHNYESSFKLLPPGSTSDVEQGGWIANPQARHIHSWASLLLPQIEESPLYRSINYDVSALDPVNLPVATTVIPLYRCPSFTGGDYSTAPSYTRFSSQYAIRNYAVMAGTDVGHVYGQNTGLLAPDGTIYPLSNTRLRDVTDGLSNTFLAVETREQQMSVWIDGGVSYVVAHPYDDGNPPTYAVDRIALNFQPYFDYPDPRSDFGPSSQHPGGAFHLFGDAAVRFMTDNMDDNVYEALSTRAGHEVVTGF